LDFLLMFILVKNFFAWRTLYMYAELFNYNLLMCQFLKQRQRLINIYNRGVKSKSIFDILNIMENNSIDTKKEFSLVRRAKSFARAGRGLWLFIRTTPNAWIQIVIFVLVIKFGVYFKVSYLEWAMLVFAGGLVFVAEAFNTSIEIDMDLTSPNYHPYARDTKDVAAGAVLLSAITAVVIGVLVFGHYLI